MKYIYTSDWLMKQEGGVETLSSEALVEVKTSHYNPLQSLCSKVLSMYVHLVIVEVCCERKLDVDLSSSQDMRKKLNVWMRISTSFEGRQI